MGYSEADRERIRQGARCAGARGMRAAEAGLRRFGFRGWRQRRGPLGLMRAAEAEPSNADVVLSVRLGLYATRDPGGEVRCFGVLQDEADNEDVRAFLEVHTGLHNHPDLRVVL